MISSEPCAFVGLVSRVHGVCHVPRFGFWGVTQIGRINVLSGSENHIEVCKGM
ncbi:hypothetical protein SLEP1_g10429 [Rubroshorea leprosula]|uniref:Uncharacterized protein n=1 Tax=Rubroshorea leprosula TaxID=152421 RepID=A0AAV5IDS8_9ROSI|nr:hypothetical protein SLEP1_g10429 [Rubroshorea leprosula]